jgi:hypothetical protein
VFVDVAVLDDERGDPHPSPHQRRHPHHLPRQRPRPLSLATHWHAQCEPNAFAWYEVSAMSDATLADPRDALDRDGVTVLGGVLVDIIDGDHEVLYRRYSADWLRVVPLDDHVGEIEGNLENFTACLGYEVSIEPLV